MSEIEEQRRAWASIERQTDNLVATQRWLEELEKRGVLPFSRGWEGDLKQSMPRQLVRKAVEHDRLGGRLVFLLRMPGKFKITSTDEWIPEGIDLVRSLIRSPWNLMAIRDVENKKDLDVYLVGVELVVKKETLL